MANELSLTYQGDAPLYALIRRHDDASPWNPNTEVFTPWDDDDLDAYAIDLTNRSGDFYQTDWPSSITPGQYHVLYYRRANAQPHVDDLLISADEVAWDGVSMSASQPPQPDGRDLVDLATIKRHMRITDGGQDATLTSLITQVSQHIERLCHRTFRSQSYRFNTRSIGGTYVLLPNYPVISVDRLASGTAAALTVTYASDQLRGSVTLDEDTLRLKRTDNEGVVITESLDLSADNPTTSQLATTISALQGWTATAHVDIPASELRPTPQISSSTQSLTLTYAPTLISSFVIEAESGLITLNCPSSNTDIYVAYQAGYETIPPDLQLLTCELVAEAFHLGRHDTNLSRETLGAYNRTMHRVTDLCAARSERIRPYLQLSLPIG